MKKVLLVLVLALGFSVSAQTTVYKNGVKITAPAGYNIAHQTTSKNQAGFAKSNVGELLVIAAKINGATVNDALLKKFVVSGNSQAKWVLGSSMSDGNGGTIQVATCDSFPGIVGFRTARRLPGNKIVGVTTFAQTAKEAFLTALKTKINK